MIFPDGRENSRQAAENLSPIGENVSYPSILGWICKSRRQRKFRHQNAAGSGSAADFVKAPSLAYFSYKTGY